MKRRVCGLVVVVAGLWVAVAMADRASATLTYTRGDGAETCPDEATLRAEVIARLGYDPFHEGASTVVVASVVARRKDLHAHVELRDAAGKAIGGRDLVSRESDCTELATAVALAIAIAIDPVTMTRVVPPAVSASAARAEVVPPPLASSAGPIAAPVGSGSGSGSGQSEVSIAMRGVVGALAGLGPTPRAAPGLRVGGGVRWPSASVDLEGRATLATAEDAQAPSRASVRASLFLASLVPCWHEGVLVGCALLSAGALHGSGQGIRDARSATTPFIALGARMAAEIPIGRGIALSLLVEGNGTATPTTLRVGAADVFRTPPVFGAVGTGLVGEFR